MDGTAPIPKGETGINISLYNQQSTTVLYPNQRLEVQIMMEWVLIWSIKLLTKLVQYIKMEALISIKMAYKLVIL